MYSLVLSSLRDRDSAERAMGKLTGEEVPLHSFHFPAESGEGMVYIVGVICRREDVERVMEVMEGEGSIKSIEIPLGLTR